jgi:protein O-mannosyl-transferase
MHLKSWTRVLILSTAVIIVYLNSFSGVFQFDDYRMVLNYARAHSIASWLYYFSHNIRPVLKASFTLNWLWGAGLFGFHFFNLLIHIANTLLIYFISLKFLSANEYAPLRNAAFIAALLFGLHPIQTEAVTYISGRSVSLMTMFYLVSLFAYIIGTERNKKILTFILSPIFFILAVMTRETALTLPAALLLWELFKKDKNGFFKTPRRQSVHWALFFIILGAVVLNAKYEELLNVSYDLRGFKDNLFSQFNGLGYLISRLVIVNGLNIDPDIPEFTGWTPVLIIKAALILSLLAFAIASFKNSRWVSFGIFWFFLLMLPTNSIIPRVDIANERHMYLPVWGLFLVVAIGIEKLRNRDQRSEVGGRKLEVRDRRPEICPALPHCHSERSEESHVPKTSIKPHLIHAGILLLLLALGFFTWSRNNDYRSEVALWEDTVQKSPKRARCYNNLGFAYELEGRYKEAKKAYEDAWNLDHDYEFAKNNLERIDAILKDLNP